MKIYLSIELSTYSVQEKARKLSTNYVLCKVAVTSIKQISYLKCTCPQRKTQQVRLFTLVHATDVKKGYGQPEM